MKKKQSEPMQHFKGVYLFDPEFPIPACCSEWRGYKVEPGHLKLKGETKSSRVLMLHPQGCQCQLRMINYDWKQGYREFTFLPAPGWEVWN